MLAFDFDPICSDDFAVLAAYALAEETAKAASTEGGSSAEGEVVTPPTGRMLSAEEDNDDPGTSKSHRQTWVRRLRDVEGVPNERLAPIHGRLIARGFLQFQLQGRNSGVVYRLSSAGHQQLSAHEESSAAASPETPEVAAPIGHQAA